MQAACGLAQLDKLDYLEQSIKRLQSTPPKFVNQYYINKYLANTSRYSDLTKPIESKLRKTPNQAQNRPRLGLIAEDPAAKVPS